MKQNNQMKFNRLVIESTYSRTDLCDLGAHHVTDKSPYCEAAASHVKHPYTPVYDFLFSTLRDKVINIGEIGIDANASMRCWREYFKNASIWGWEYDAEKIKRAEQDNLEDTTYLHMDVRDSVSIREGLSKPNVLFDIIIEDSSHRVQDQIRITQQVHQFISPGGYFIIEDVDKQHDLAGYYEAFADVLKYYTSVTVVDADHENKVRGNGTFDTPYDDNRLIVMVRNNQPAE